MLEKAIKVLERLEENGFSAYIVGGFVRDYLIGRESSDIDICTSATPKEIKEIFVDAFLPSDDYGSVILEVGNYKYEITTYRRELDYSVSRKPIEIIYIDNLREDLDRRDFLINTICMNSKKEIIDLLNGKDDLDKRIISCVGDSYVKFSEDPLRILRAIRFSTILDFDLDNNILYAIKRCKKLLSNLSYNRKREELDKIFSSINIKKGVKLILELGLDEDLELDNLEKLLDMEVFDLLGVWSVIKYSDKYPFSNNEKNLVKNIREIIEIGEVNSKTLYRYDLYENTVAGNILGIDKKSINIMYKDMPINSRGDLCINGDDIINILKIEPSHDIEIILKDIELKVLDKKLDNNRKSLSKYIVKTYL